MSQNDTGAGDEPETIGSLGRAILSLIPPLAVSLVAYVALLYAGAPTSAVNKAFAAVVAILIAWRFVGVIARVTARFGEQRERRNQ
jgi:hypothetical protein